IKALVARSVADALAEHEANRSINEDDSHDSGSGRRRQVKGTYVVSYTQRFQELALMCGRMFPEESDQVEKYVRGLPDMCQCSVMASNPKTMQEAIEIANDMMD
nr:reverse transcriptase domain-containing protein [Tanacetum cinerariifolium]